MEIHGLKEVKLEDMSEEHREWSNRMWEIFDRGVKAAKAENERLGIKVNESPSYLRDDSAPVEVPLVSESDEE
ncbi:MAG: hypothetical protein P1U89_19725 [Verrucomicrobiales bacterium]|nr:hypothetical protein [Verrucomicrobiales bacterium]